MNLFSIWLVRRVQLRSCKPSTWLIASRYQTRGRQGRDAVTDSPGERTASEQAALIDYMRSFQVPIGWDMPRLLDAFQRAMAEGAPAEPRLETVLIAERGDWRVEAEILRPAGPGPHSVVVYVHGGGFTTGTPRGYRRIGQELAARGHLVIVPDYRRAPRHRFPAALDDCRATIAWARRHGEAYGGDPDRVTLMGDSAGANLAAACLVTATAGISSTVLVYGLFDYYAALPVLGPIIGGPGRDEQLYLPVEDFDHLRHDPRVSPLLGADRLPRCLLAVGTADPLVAHTDALAAAIRDRGGVPRVHRYAGAPHGFLQMPFHPAHDQAYADIDRFLRSPAQTDRQDRP